MYKVPLLKMYPANNGDSFLIKIDSPHPQAILVDGGYVSTFKNHILSDLKKLNEQGLCLDLVISTHIDADHISGLIEFFKQNGHSGSPKIISVKNVWHNSVRSIGTSSSDNIEVDDLELLTEIKRQGFPSPSENETAISEISAKQGSSLAALLLSGDYQWNMCSGSQSINCEDTPDFNFGEHIQLQIISPQLDRLKQLHIWWIKELRRHGFIGELGTNEIFDDAFEFLCADKRLNLNNPTLISASTSDLLEDLYEPDTSETNASSIAFIANIGQARLLFLGDAFAEDIEAQLKKLVNTNSLIFDAIKISHHGSLHSTSPSLLGLIDAPAFLISSNGKKHNHPDIEVLKAIVDRPCKFTRTLYFNYSTPASKELKNYKSKSGASFTIFENATNWIDLNMESL